MGQFSWKTSDTKESIKIGDRVVIYYPDGTKHIEYSYGGYGIFNGVDFYLAVVRYLLRELCESKKFDNLRNYGISLCSARLTEASMVSYLRSIETIAGRDISSERWPKHMRIMTPRFSFSEDKHYDELSTPETCPYQGCPPDEEDKVVLRIHPSALIHPPGFFRWIREGLAKDDMAQAQKMLEALGIEKEHAFYLSNFNNPVTTEVDGDTLIVTFYLEKEEE